MKKTWIRKALSVGILATGALLLAPAAMAQAEVNQTHRVVENTTEHGLLGGLGGLGGLFGGVSQVSIGSFGTFSTLNGDSFAMPVSIPLSSCGNSLALLGAASSYGTCGGGGGFASVTQVVDAVAVPVRQHFVRSDNYSSCSAYVVDSPCAAGAAAYGAADAYDVDVVDGYDPGDYVAYDTTQYVEPVAVPVDTCGNSLDVYGYAGAYGSCGGGADVVYTQSVQYVDPIVPVYTTPAYVLGGSDCTCAPAGGNVVYGYPGDVRGQAQGYINRAPKKHRNNQGDVRGAKGYGDEGDVRGAKGYGDEDQDEDTAGYDQGSARDEDPVDAEPAPEKFSATSVNRSLTGLGTLDMLGAGSLR